MASQDEFDLEPSNLYSQSNTTSQADPPFFSLFVKTPQETGHKDMKMPSLTHNYENMLPVPLQVGVI